MIAFKGTHYGEEVWLYHTDESESALDQVINALSEKGIKFELLPVVDWRDELFVDILKYTSQNDGNPVYVTVCGAEGCFLQTRKLPDDMDIKRLIYDILWQEKGNKPMIIPSKFRRMLDGTLKQADEVIAAGNFSEVEQYAIALFRKKAESEMSDEEKVDEWNEDPVGEKTMFLYRYKVAADLLVANGYDYTYLKRYAEIDHHDAQAWQNDLELLYDGFYWRSTLEE